MSLTAETICIIGRRVSYVVSQFHRSVSHLLLVFADGTDYEFYAHAMFWPVDSDDGRPCGLVGKVIRNAIVCQSPDGSTLSFQTVGGNVYSFASRDRIQSTHGLYERGIDHVLRAGGDCVLTHYSSSTDDDPVPESLVSDERLSGLLSRLGTDAIRRGVGALLEYHEHLDRAGDWDRNFLASAYGEFGALRTAVQAHQAYHANVTIGSGDDFFRIVGDITGLGLGAVELHRLYVLQPSRVRRLAAHLSGTSLHLEVERDRAIATQVKQAMDDAAALTELGRHTDAVTFLIQAVAIDPLDYDACAELADTFKNMREYDQALRVAEYAISLWSGHAAPYMDLGLILIAMRRTYAGIQSLERGVAVEPDHALTHHYLGICYAALGRRPELQREIGILRRLNPAWAAELRAESIKTRRRFQSQQPSPMLRRVSAVWSVIRRRIAVIAPRQHDRKG